MANPDFADLPGRLEAVANTARELLVVYNEERALRQAAEATIEELQAANHQLRNEQDDKLQRLQEVQEAYQRIQEAYQQIRVARFILHDSPHRFVAGPNYTLTADNQTAQGHGGGQLWNVVVKGLPLPQVGRIRWNFKILAPKPSYPVPYHFGGPTSVMMMGVAPVTIDQNVAGQFRTCGYYLDTFNSGLCSGPPYNFGQQGPQQLPPGIPAFAHGPAPFALGQQYGGFGQQHLSHGDSVGVEVDMTTRSVTFWVGGVNPMVAYNHIPAEIGPLCPCVIMIGQEGRVRINQWDYYVN